MSVTRESEGGGLAKREVGMQDVKLRPDGDDDAFSDEGDAEAAPAPSTGSGATSEREGGLHDVKLSDVEAAPAPAPSTASGATSEVAPSTAATTVAAARRISAAGVEHCRTVWRSPVQRVRVAWRATLLLSFFVAVSALVAAAHNDTDAGGRKSAGFAAIWSTFLVLGVIYGGARVLDNSWSSDLARALPLRGVHRPRAREARLRPHGQRRSRARSRALPDLAVLRGTRGVARRGLPKGDRGAGRCSGGAAARDRCGRPGFHARGASQL